MPTSGRRLPTWRDGDSDLDLAPRWLPHGLSEQLAGDEVAHRLDLLGRECSAEGWHVLPAIPHCLHDRGHIAHLVQRRTAAVAALAIGAMTGQAGLLEYLRAGARAARSGRSNGRHGRRAYFGI